MPASSRSDASSRKFSPTQHRRPRSPVSMYVSDFGFAPPRQPKLLPKLAPKNKGKGKQEDTSTSRAASTSSYSPSQSTSSQSAFASSSNASFASAGTGSSTKSKLHPLSLAPILKTLRRKSSAKPTPSVLPPPAVPPKDTALTSPLVEAAIRAHQTGETTRIFGEKSPVRSVRSGLGDSPNSDTVRDSTDSYPDTIQFARTAPSVTFSAYDQSPPYSPYERKTSAPSPPPWLTVDTGVPPPRPPRRRPKTAPSPRIQTHNILLLRPGSSALGPTSSSPLSSLSPPSSTTDSDEVEPEPKTPRLSRSRSTALTTHDRKLSQSVTRPETPFMDSSIPMQAYLSATWSSRHESNDNVMRKERSQGWSGEWNRDNMQDVIEKLRTLK